MKKLLLYVMLLLPVSTWAQSKKKVDNNALPATFHGNWKANKNCDGPTCFAIEQWNPIAIEMNGGKVKFNARAVPNPENPSVVQLFLMEPDNDDENVEDTVMHWHDYALDRPIADLRYVSNEDNLRISWKGFYNKRTKKYEYKNEPEWKNTKPKGCLYRCATSE